VSNVFFDLDEANHVLEGPFVKFQTKQDMPYTLYVIDKKSLEKYNQIVKGLI
jgi:hypothetical protein